LLHLVGFLLLHTLLTMHGHSNLKFTRESPVFLWSYLQANISRYPFLLPFPNFPNIINPTQTVSPSQPVTYSFPSPFPRFRLK